MPCKLVLNGKHVMPGWGCCSCRTYNGLQRACCKRCGHECCVEKPSPEAFGLCPECGIPKGGRHVGHLDGAVFGSDEQTVFTLAERVPRPEGSER